MSYGKFGAIATGGQRGFVPHFSLLKILFWNIMYRHKNRQQCKKEKKKQKQKTFNSTYLANVTYFNSRSKFLNTESLVVQVLNITFYI